SQNLHPNNSPDLFKSDTGDDRLPQNPVGGGVGKYDKVELRTLGNEAAHEVKPHNNATLTLALDVIDHLLKGVYILPLLLSSSDRS
ncbi:hypothetical protein, partial [Thiolapillus sp.]|uniref:hypothetical protein n=3 Tax=Thiolapillus sp. TaxID=2017437 RepID=UPI002738AA85